jgi:tetratricopeptide (TPR) repeat protein
MRDFARALEWQVNMTLNTSLPTATAAWLAFWLMASAACNRQPAAAPEHKHEQAAAKSAGALHFIEDDYEHALASARERNVPLFVDVWASWCHTCLSMKQYVLTDPALAKLSSSFVWLAIDSERPSNAAFLQRFPTRNLPTLWVVESSTQVPLLKWIGAATARELTGVLEDALQARSIETTQQPVAAGAAEVNTLWLRGQRASAAGESEQAIGFYKRALELAPPAWIHRAQTAEALSMRLAESNQSAASIELAAREAPNMPTSTSRLNVILNAISASEQLPTDAPERGALPALIELATHLAETPSEAVLLDDRSSVYLSLVTVLKSTKPEESKRLARNWSNALDAQASRETDPARRRVWDPHRVEAYLALGEAARAVPMLEQSEREAPDDYNAAARLARVYLTLQRLGEAQAAIERALALANGPRKLRFYTLKADIQEAGGDKAAARTTLTQALEFARSSQLPLQYTKQLTTLEQRANTLASTAPAL